MQITVGDKIYIILDMENNEVYDIAYDFASVKESLTLTGNGKYTVEVWTYENDFHWYFNTSIEYLVVQGEVYKKKYEKQL